MSPNADITTTPMTAICNASILACFYAVPDKVINLLAGGVALLTIAIVAPYIIWKTNVRSDAR